MDETDIDGMKPDAICDIEREFGMPDKALVIYDRDGGQATCDAGDERLVHAALDVYGGGKGPDALLVLTTVFGSECVIAASRISNYIVSTRRSRLYGRLYEDALDRAKRRGTMLDGEA